MGMNWQNQSARSAGTLLRRIAVLFLIAHAVSKSARCSGSDACDQVIQERVNAKSAFRVETFDHTDLILIQVTEGGYRDAAIPKHRTQGQGFIAAEEAFIGLNEGLQRFR